MRRERCCRDARLRNADGNHGGDEAWLERCEVLPGRRLRRSVRDEGAVRPVKFIPTGGVNTQNIGEFIAAPFIHAVGGSWVCPKADIAAGKFEKITELCKQARSAALGFEVAHIGVNCEDAAAASAVCEKLNEAFDLPVKDGSSSMFASSGIEVMKSMFKGKNGHIAIRTNSVELAVAELAKKGFAYDESSAKYKNGRMTVAYLKDEFGGFAVHLLQK